MKVLETLIDNYEANEDWPDCTYFLHSTKIAFQEWVTQVWSRIPIFKIGLKHFCKIKNIFFFQFRKEWPAQISEKKNHVQLCTVLLNYQKHQYSKHIYQSIYAIRDSSSTECISAHLRVKVVGKHRP